MKYSLSEDRKTCILNRYDIVNFVEGCLGVSMINIAHNVPLKFNQAIRLYWKDSL
jgi:hypothetical protein